MRSRHERVRLPLWATAAALAGLAVLAPAAPAEVADRLPPIALTVHLAGCPIDIDPWTCGELVPLPDGTFHFRGEVGVDGLGDVRWSVRYDPDPVVIANVAVTNATGDVAGYSISVHLPTSLPAPTLVGGTIVGQFCDGLGDGAVISAPEGGAIYVATIDGLPVDGGALLEWPFSQRAGPAECLPMGPVEFGSPVPGMPSGPVALSIGITLQFTLSGHDTASFMSQFTVEPAAGAATGGAGTPTGGPDASSGKEMP